MTTAHPAKEFPKALAKGISTGDLITPAVIYPCYILMPLLIILALLPWATRFNIPHGRTVLLPLAGVILMGGLAEGFVQAEAEGNTKDKAIALVSGLSHVIPFLLMAFLCRPKSALRWNSALMGGVYIAIGFILTLYVTYTATDSYPFFMDLHTAAYACLSGILIALLVGSNTNGLCP